MRGELRVEMLCYWIINFVINKKAITFALPNRVTG